MTGNTLYQKIENLKEQEILPEITMKICDVMRIYGNKAGAHSGCIDLENEDNANIVNTLKVIEDPNKIDNMLATVKQKNQEN